MSASEFDTDVALAAELATEAGKLLVELRRDSGLSGKKLGRAGDLQSNEWLLEQLAVRRPDDVVLSEESADDRSRLQASRVWIVDPVDGTREYGIDNHADWAVHVALWTAGSGLVGGAVSLPALGVTYDSSSGAVHSATGLMSTPRGDVPRVVVSRSRPPTFSDAVARAIGGVVVPLGSAGAKAMAVVRGEADAYVHAGGQYEWDSAAPVAVARAAGLWCSRIDGSPLVYNQSDVYLPDLVICRANIASVVLDAIT